jgi:hypothetical protein
MQLPANLSAATGDAMLDTINSDRMRESMKTMLLAGLGLGATARGVNGLYNVARRNISGPATPMGPRALPIPVVDQEEKEAGLGEWLGNTLKPIGDFFAGRQATSTGGIPLAYPAMFLAGTGGIVGGWKATDALLDKQRKRDLEAELGSAREDYEKALLKQGAEEASELGRDLDRLFELCVAAASEKQANSLLDSVQNTVTGAATPLLAALGLKSMLGADNAGKTVGMALTVPTAIAMGSAAAAYGATRSSQKEQLLQKAIRQRRHRQLAAGPLYAYPSQPDGTPYAG